MKCILVNHQAKRLEVEINELKNVNRLKNYVIKFFYSDYYITFALYNIHRVFYQILNDF